MDFFKKDFGDKLRTALKNAGKSQSDLAKFLDVKDATVSRWVTGKDSPEPKRYEKIFSFLNVDKSFFLNPIENKPPLEQAMMITEAQLKALTTESAKTGAKAMLDAINKPNVESLNSDRALLLKLVDSMSDVEIRKLYPTYKSLLSKLRARNIGKKTKSSS